jgi:hypothetical protein
MKIEQLGFYLTRKGFVYEVVTILPDSYPSHCRVVAIGKDEEVRSWNINGYSRDAHLYDAELVRYLPTVKSFADPIPPTVKQSLTVDIPGGFVLLPEGQPKKAGDKFRFEGSSEWQTLNEVLPGEHSRRLSGAIYITPATEPVPPIIDAPGWYLLADGSVLEFDIDAYGYGVAVAPHFDCVALEDFSGGLTWCSDGTVHDLEGLEINEDEGTVEDWTARLRVIRKCDAPPELNERFEHKSPPLFRDFVAGEYYYDTEMSFVHVGGTDRRTLRNVWIVDKIETVPPKTKTITEWLCKSASDSDFYYKVSKQHKPENAIKATGETFEVPE